MKNNTSVSQIKLFAGSARHAYQAHQAAWSFIGKSPSESRHFHHDYKLLPANNGSLITIRALSCYLPEEATVIQIRYEAEQILEFDLSAVASITKTKDKETACITHDDYVHWLESRSVDKGFRISMNSLQIDNEAALIVKPGNPAFYLNKAYFTGTLTVTDTERFAQTLISGIGRHRGLGFGMLTITNNL